MAGGPGGGVGRSLAGSDGGRRAENNHQRGDYREYFVHGDLAPHYLTRGADGEIYSVHPVGLPVLLAPFYALGGYVAVRLALIVIAATAGALAWSWMRRLGQPAGAAFFAWLAVYCSAPFLLHSIAVYPEVTAGLAVLLAMTIATTTPPGGGHAEGAARGVVGRWIGPVSNVLSVARMGQVETMTLGAEEARELSFPVEAGRTQFQLSAANGFVPAEIDPASRDQRDLGCWIEITGWTR